jgi:hypothetical protein
VFVKYTKPFLAENKEIVNRIGTIYCRVLSHFTVNSDIKTQVITEVRDNILAIADLLEESSVETLEGYNDNNYR